ncbi:hypothetical protein J1614_006515 [Plenodomus biglobosus]|nr:hypothetical protein J1614_006515 [Plenodomus biglobosus]
MTSTPLAVISEEEYDTQAQSQEPIYRLKDSTEPRTTPSPSRMIQVQISPTPVKEDDSIEVSTTKCLFCSHSSSSMSENIDHMSINHGLFIPSPDRLYDLETFLGYLATVIFEYYECLYCGLAKGTVDGVQTHMRDKGHCMLNLQPESELLDFWETEDIREDEEEEKNEQTTAAIKLSETEMRLPSGAVVNSRSDTAQLRVKPSLAHSRIRGSQYRSRRAAQAQAITAGEDKAETADQPPTKSASRNDRRIAVRSEMGLTGISENQRRALQVTEMKMRKREVIAKTAGRHAMEQQPVKTKYYKTEAPIYQAG